MTDPAHERSPSNTLFSGTKVTPEDYKFGVFMECFSDLFRHIFDQLKVNPKQFKVLLSIPQNFAPTVKLKILEILFDEFGVQGVTAGEDVDVIGSE